MDRSPILLMCWLCCLVTSQIDAADVADSWHSHLVDDATLHDVVFVDAEYGCAVGDHGAIWHTTDGGRGWNRQTVPTSVDLHGVWFVDRKLGWVVGGKTVPFLWTSQATLLRTIDGGQTWEPQLALLPALEHVKFFDAERGVAWGRGSGGEPLGVFASDDSGRNWRTVAVGWPSAWWGGDFTNQHSGTVVGPRQVARISNGDAAKLDLGEETIRVVRYADNGTAWAVGERGTILRSQDSGASWNPVEVLPDDLRASLDWHTVATHGKHVWIAGSPGTVVLHSPDGGVTWQGHATGSTAPLRKITFADDQLGWAVGDLGTILHTSDGGKSWQVQHRGGERAAVLVICTDERQIPFETLARLSADGYRTAVYLLQPIADVEPTHHARLAEALTSVGCTAFSTSAIDAAESPTQPAEQLARQLRIWRPAVLVVPGDEKQFEDIAGLAIKRAADAAQLPHLAEQLALPPWKVSRVFAQLPPGGRGTHRVQSADTVPHLSKTLGEMAAAARSLLHQEFQTPPDTNEFLLKANHAGEPTASVDDLAAGLSIAPGSDSRRPVVNIAPTFDPQAQRRLVEKRRNMANIFRFAEGKPALLAQVGQMMGDLAEDAAAGLLYELAAQFEQSGQVQLAVEVRELLVRRCPNDSLVEPTLVWLVEFYASSETAHAYRQIATESTLTGPRAPLRSRVDGPRNSVQPAAAFLETQTDQTTNNHTQRRYTRAVQLAEHVAQTRPLLNAEPQLRVPAAIAQRNLSTPEPNALASGDGIVGVKSEPPEASAIGSQDRAERYLQSLALRYPGEAWQECGAVERWLAEPDKPLPKKKRVTCRFTDGRPNLDGKLDEKLWSNSVTLQTVLKSAIANPGYPLGAEIHLAHDEQYLYLGVLCAKSADVTYSSESGPRTYDADLSQQDRVRLLLDLDRDYTTYFVLTVDHRGWTNDACWQDKTWNPKWFVSARGNTESWTIEAAIPWAELTDTSPKIGDAWAIACERITPNVGTQVLTGEDVSGFGPERFGVMVFK